jgi:septal ring-binding cell division protein DamX
MVNVRIHSSSRAGVSPAKSAVTIASLLLPLLALVVYVAAHQPVTETTEDASQETQTTSVRISLSDDATTFEAILEPLVETPSVEELLPVESLDGPPLPLDFDLAGQQVSAPPASNTPVDRQSDLDSGKRQRLEDALRSQIKVGEPVAVIEAESVARSPSDIVAPVQTTIADAPAPTPVAEPVSVSIAAAPAPVAEPVSVSIADDTAPSPAAVPVRVSISDHESPSIALPAFDISIFTITKSPLDFSGKGESPTPNWRKPAH